MPYTKNHIGNVNITHNAKHEDKKELKSLEQKNIADNDIKTHVETRETTDYSKEVIVEVKGDITHKSNTAQRDSVELSLTGQQGMNWEIGKLELNAKESNITTKEHSPTGKVVQASGNTIIFANKVDFGNDGTSLEELFGMQTVEDTVRKVVANTQAGMDGKYKHDEKKEEQEKPNKPLINLPDMDASILCELVYENKALDFTIDKARFKDSSLAEVFYENKTTVRQDEGFSLSVDKYKNLNMPLDEYSEYYYDILKRYKLVATSSELGNDVNYYAIAVTSIDDNKNEGVYIINRGTTTNMDKVFDIPYNAPDIASDLEMVLAKVFPATMVVKHVTAGIKFAEYVKKTYNTKSMSFAGHSLGGSIAQLQSVYFIDDMIGQTKCFEPFGLLSEVAPTFRLEANGMVYYITLNPFKSIKSQVCALGYYWDCDGWQDIEDKLIAKYAGAKNRIEVKNDSSMIISYIREGDIVGTFAEPVGYGITLPTGLGVASTGELHSITNYRYQGYRRNRNARNDMVGTTNSDILMKSEDKPNCRTIAIRKKMYNACFSKMMFFEEMKIEKD